MSWINGKPNYFVWVGVKDYNTRNAKRYEYANLGQILDDPIIVDALQNTDVSVQVYNANSEDFAFRYRDDKHLSNFSTSRMLRNLLAVAQGLPEPYTYCTAIYGAKNSPYRDTTYSALFNSNKLEHNFRYNSIREFTAATNYPFINGMRLIEVKHPVGSYDSYYITTGCPDTFTFMDGQWIYSVDTPSRNMVYNDLMRYCIAKARS